MSQVLLGRSFAVAVLLLSFTSAIIAAQDEEPEPTVGWKAEKDTGEKALREEIPAFSDSERVRYLAVARTLVETINSGDLERYRQLFTDEGWQSATKWWTDMFALQKEKLGFIERAYEPRRGYLRIGSLAYLGEVEDGAILLVIFEKPKGGALNFKLDESGRIARTDAFIHASFAAAEPEGLQLIYSRRDSTGTSEGG